MSKYTVTPSIGVNIRSGPGTGYGKVGAYPMGTVVDVLEERDGWGRTNKGWVSLAYLEAVEGPQRVTDTGLAIQTHLIAPGADNRLTAIPASTSPSTRPATRPRAPTPRPTLPTWTAMPGSATW